MKVSWLDIAVYVTNVYADAYAVYVILRVKLVQSNSQIPTSLRNDHYSKKENPGLNAFKIAKNILFNFK